MINKLGNELFIPQSMRDEREKYFKSLCQPWREGIPSKEFAEFYPNKARKLFGNMQTYYVYKDLPGWEHRHKSL